MPVGCFLFGRGMKGEKDGGDVAQVGRYRRHVLPRHKNAATRSLHQEKCGAE